MPKKTKEFGFRPNISKHDLEIKIQKIKKLLEKGFEVRTFVTFRGRAIIHQEIGLEILKSIGEDVADIAKLKQSPLLKGRVLSTILVPRNKSQNDLNKGL